MYRAYDRREDRSVALKVLRNTASPAGALRFKREFAMTARLRHLRILRVFDAGEIDGRLWFTMPLVNNETLRARLERDGRLPIGDATRLLRENSEGLAYAHAEGIVHRDLKPENILLDGEHPIITDFGVAKAVFIATQSDAGSHPDVPERDGIRTATGVGIGTPAYMSPEQLVGARSVDHRADLYALGVLGYEVIAGVRPLTGATRQALFTAHLTERPVSLAEHRREVPKALATLVSRLLEKKAAGRPADASTVVAAFDDIIGSLGDDSASTRSNHWWHRWFRRSSE